MGSGATTAAVGDDELVDTSAEPRDLNVAVIVIFLLFYIVV